MNNKLNKSKTPSRRYPALYEKIIPIAIGSVFVILLVLLAITFGVALGLLAGPV